jgi:hypothetical protein
VSALTYARNNANVAYVGTTTGQLFVRTAAPSTYSAMTAPAWDYGAYATEIVVDPEDYRTAYVLDNNGKVWRTTDAGATAGGWTELTNNLGFLSPSVRTLALYDPSPAGPGAGMLLAGGLGGVFRLPLTAPSPSSGVIGGAFLTLDPSTWTQFGQGLPNVLVTDLHYVPGANVLLAGTLGRGAWTIYNASSYLGNPVTLTYNAVTAGENIRLVRDPANRAYDDLTVNGGTPYVFPLASVQQIRINQHPAGQLRGGHPGRGHHQLRHQRAGPQRPHDRVVAEFSALRLARPGPARRGRPKRHHAAQRLGLPQQRRQQYSDRRRRP